MPNTVQNVLGGASSIIAYDPPPEGKAGTQVTFTVDPAVGFVAQMFQMNSAAGLALSQVCSLVIDNTQNPCAITVTHGALSEKTTVAALGLQIVPSFSNKAPFPVSISLVPGSNALPPASIVNITFLNYNRPTASVGGSNGVSANAPQTTAGNPVTTGLQAFTAAGQGVATFVGIQNADTSYPAGVWYLYNLDLTIGSVTSIAPGPVIVDIELGAVPSGGGPPIWNLNWHAVGVATSAAQIIPLNQWRNWQFNPTPIVGQFAAGGKMDPDPAAFITTTLLTLTNASAVNYCTNIVRNVVLS